MRRGAFSPRNWHDRDDEPSGHGASSPQPERDDWKDVVVEYRSCAILSVFSRKAPSVFKTIAP